MTRRTARGIRSRVGAENFGQPTNAALTFDRPSFSVATDAGDGIVLFNVTISGHAGFVSRGFSFSNWQINAGLSDFDHVEIGASTSSTAAVQSDGMVFGDAGLRTVYVTVDYDGPSGGGTLTASIMGTVEAPPGSVVTTFDLVNYSATASPEIHTMGLLFARGAVPSGSTIRIVRAADDSVVPFVMERPSSWDDGSLQWTGGLHLNGDEDISGSAFRTYNVQVVGGSRTPSASGYDPWSYLSANTNMILNLTGMKVGISTGADMSPSTRPITFNDHMTVTTRRRVLVDSAQIMVLYCWGMAQATGNPNNVDGHIVGEHFVFLYREAGGAVRQVQYVCTPRQGWFTNDPLSSGESKDRRQYFAELLNGASSIQQYFGDGASARVAHPAHSAWATVVRTGQGRGRPHVLAVGTDQRTPTLWTRFNVPELLAAQVIQELDTDVVPAYGLTMYDYNPGDNFNTRVDIDGTGASDQRGPLMKSDCLRLIKQDADNAAEFITTAYSGMHIPMYSVRNHVSDGTDITFRIIPFATQSLSSTQTGNFVTSDITGLGARQRYQNNNNYARRTLTWQAIPNSGGSPPPAYSTPMANWVPGGDNSHAPPYGFLAAVLSGYPWFRDVAIDTAMRSVWAASGAGTSWEQQHREGALVSNGGEGYVNHGWVVRYSSPIQTDLQTRGYGWGIVALSNGYVVAGDGTPEKQVMSELLDVWGAYNKRRYDQLAAMPTTRRYDRRVTTAYLSGGRPTGGQQWEQAFVAIGHILTARRCPDKSDLVFLANFHAGQMIKAASDPVYPMRVIRWFTPYFLRSSDTYSPPTTDIWPSDPFHQIISRVNASNTTQLNISLNGAPLIHRNYFKPTVGDAVWFGQYNVLAFPSTVTPGATFYIKEILNGGAQMTFSTSPGGAAFDFGAHTASFHMWCEEPQAMAGKVNLLDPDLLMGAYNNWDDYGPIGLMGLYLAVRYGSTLHSSGDNSAALANAQTFYDNHIAHIQTRAAVDGSFYPNWLVARP